METVSMPKNLWDFNNDLATFSNVITTPAMVLLVWPAVLIMALLPVLWYWWIGRISRSNTPKVHAFFHPYCSGGGGGERVLWKIVQSLQTGSKKRKVSGKDDDEQKEQQSGPPKIVIFTIDPPDTDEAKIRQEAQRRFDVDIPHPIELVSLEDCQNLLNPRPFLSLIMESWGTMQLAYEGFQRYNQKWMNRNRPIDVYWDTTGCAFTFWVARWMCPSAWVVAYVHYPTISIDMMAWEWQQNKERAMCKTLLKLLYYWGFAFLYGMTGRLPDQVMVNSTWTYNHIKRLWGSSRRIHIVYPPCRVPPVAEQDDASDRSRTIVSIGQFRPEKDHALQIESLNRLFEVYPQHKPEGVQLLLIGSCRNDLDQKRVDALKELVAKRKLEAFVRFSINPPYNELQESMGSCLVGIHTMRQEHFGIGIVEMMAAGLIVVAHNSGGPKTDILQHKLNGFLATTAAEYAESLHQALTFPAQEARILREQARAAATRFSDSAFEDALSLVLSNLANVSF